MAVVLWSQRALKNVDDIASYISNDSVQYARKFVSSVFSYVDILESQPLIGRVVPELCRSAIRELIFQRYRIVYHVIDDTIYILAVQNSLKLLTNQILN